MMRKISSVRPVRFPAEYGPPGEADALLAWSDVEERIRAAPNHWITTVKKKYPRYFSGDAPFRPFWTLRPTTVFAWTLEGFPRDSTRWRFAEHCAESAETPIGPSAVSREAWMRNTRLIFVDGLPGSGKSMTAEFVASELGRRDIPCRLLRERETDHPLNVGGDLHPSGNTTGAHLFAAYDVRSFVEESLARWNAFAAEARCSSCVHVLDSYPFQNSVRVLLQMDTDSQTLAAYQARVAETVAALDPVMIYLDAGDAGRGFRAIAEQRGPAWTEYAIRVITESPYASSRNLRAMDGAVAILQAYKQLLDEAVGRHPFPTLVLADCHQRWEACHVKIAPFLGLEAFP